MIVFIQRLIEKKHAYVIDNDVCFDVMSFEDYGKLSGKKLNELRIGARIKRDMRKKNPEDFVLWKGNEAREFWRTEWGYGRPGWHLECSVMSRIYLGNTIDIHGGGMDLVFPHHENEIAQSESLTGKPFVKYWLHNAFVNINKEKMSKSLGNFFTLRVVFEKFDPMVLRFFFLQHQYRMPLEFNLNDLKASEITYKKLITVFKGMKTSDITLKEVIKYRVIEHMVLALCDDFNTPKLFGILFEHLSDIKQDENLKQKVKSFLITILGLTFESLEEEKIIITPEIRELITKRERAREEKNWELSDNIRDQLRNLGYEVQDKRLK
jgi:cysteinyl-tRNA synthetase